MDKQTLNKVASVINALNSIEVKGKANLMNLGGCIAVIEEVCQEIAGTINDHDNEDSADKK